MTSARAAPPARARRAAALAMLGAALAAWAIVWAGAIAAPYQAAAVLAGLALALTAPQPALRHRGALLLAKTAGFIAGVLLIAEIGSIILVLTGTIWPPVARFGDGERSMVRDSALLGYEPDREGAVRAVKRGADGAVIYDTTYTFAGGLRATRGDPKGPCTVLFMIDSFAFGDGLADADTLPQRFSEAAGFRLNVVNLGYSGYGPQQMLAWLESPRLDRFVTAPLAAAYYISLDDHPRRLAGLTYWSRFDPRYALVEGKVLRTGRFHSPPSLASFDRFRRDLPGLLSASSFFHYVIRPYFPDPPERLEATRALFTEALGRADALLRARYKAPLTILVWQAADLTGPALAELARRGLDVVRVESLVGPLTDEYRIPNDGHPSAFANRRLGEALARRLARCPPR